MTVYVAGSDAEPPDGARHRAVPPTETSPREIRQRAAQELHLRRPVTRDVASRDPENRGVLEISAIEAELRMREERLRERASELRAREERLNALDARARHMEDRARFAAQETRLAELRLAELQNAVTREPVRPAAVRGDRAAAAHAHELARLKAKFLDGEAAGADLAERLRFAHRQVGKLSLENLGTEVGYSKATLSKVFNGKMHPTWGLVRKLGIALKVPQTLVMQEWLPLWIAADTHRQEKPVPCPEDTGVLINNPSPALTAPTGHICPKCGSWVVDVARHTGWHMTQEPGGPPPDAESLGEGWNGQSQELTLLREALGGEAES